VQPPPSAALQSVPSVHVTTPSGRATSPQAKVGLDGGGGDSPAACRQDIGCGAYWSPLAALLVLRCYAGRCMRRRGVERRRGECT